MQNNTAHILVLSTLNKVFFELVDCLAKASETSVNEAEKAESKKLLVRMNDWISEYKFGRETSNNLLESGMDILNSNYNFCQTGITQYINRG